MGEDVRLVADTFVGMPTMEGAGVRLSRLFGHPEVPRLDPFLLFDNFSSRNPLDYEAGFPWHPHRGIETVTYMLEGRVEHGDTLGNAGAIDSGDVQWMSAGSGILHQEMPQRRDGLLQGFQLWVNLPARQKMSNPAYRGLTRNQIPSAKTAEGASVKVVAGRFGDVEGPVAGISIDPTYLDVTLPAGGEFRLPTRREYTVFSYQVEGSSFPTPGSERPTRADTVILYGPGEEVRLRGGPEGSRSLLVSGRPLHEPVAWYGPIVMNRRDELAEAMVQLQRGDFLQHREPVVEE